MRGGFQLRGEDRGDIVKRRGRAASISRGTRILRLTALSTVVLMLGCGGRPQLTKEGIHQTCPTSGCLSGQTCVEAAGAGGTTKTCEIRCTKDSECPEGTKCNLPPVLPDSIPNTCQ